MPSLQTGCRGVRLGGKWGCGRLPEGAPRRGVVGAGAAGAGLAARLLGVTALRLRRRGPMADAEGLGPRLLPRLLDSGVEAGAWEVWERPGRVRPRGRTHAERAAWGSNGSHSRSRPAFFKTESCDSQWLPPEQSGRGATNESTGLEADGGSDRKRNGDMGDGWSNQPMDT